MSDALPSSLASTRRAGASVEARARRMRRQFIRRNWRLLGIALLGLLAAAGGSLLVEDAFERGLLLGVALTSIIAVTTGLVIILSGSASTTLGGWAEGWTAEQLQPLLDHGYELIHHAGLKLGDIDHFMVGPAGVFVIETKWSSHEWSTSRGDWFLSKAVRQVNATASDVALWLSNRREVHVQPVLVLWGSAALALKDSDGGVQRSPDGVLVIEGSSLRDWALRLPRTALSTERVHEIHAKMAQQVGKRDDREAPAPKSILGLVVDATVTFVVSVFALYLPALATNALGLTGLTITAAAQGAAALVLRRAGGWRWPTTAVLLVSALWIALILVREVLTLVS